MPLLLCGGDIRTDATGIVLMRERNNVQNTFLEKFLESTKKLRDEVPRSLDLLGGAYWFRTSDLLNVSKSIE